MRPGRMIWLLAIGTLFSFAAWGGSAHAQESFYNGKTIRLIVGLAPGGGYDLSRGSSLSNDQGHTVN
jgi:tripartite-type tricarboxylate transporter receptor subunit TctC